jgi:hypothetical protein
VITPPLSSPRRSEPSEAQAISQQIKDIITRELRDQLVTSASKLKVLGEAMVLSMCGNRPTDLVLNMIDIVAQNPYGHLCEVYWWVRRPSQPEALTEP